MSVNEIMSAGKINPNFIDSSSLILPIANVTNLQANLNALQDQLNVFQFAEFFALMPPDNAVAVAVGDAVEFPQDGPSNSFISRTTASTFALPDVGTYEVSFCVTVAEAGQLALALDGVLQARTVVGRSALTSQIAGRFLLTTVAPVAILSRVNPAGNATALTITALAGGTHDVSANLIVKRLQ